MSICRQDWLGVIIVVDRREDYRGVLDDDVTLPSYCCCRSYSRNGHSRQQEATQRGHAVPHGQHQLYQTTDQSLVQRLYGQSLCLLSVSSSAGSLITVFIYTVHWGRTHCITRFKLNVYVICWGIRHYIRHRRTLVGSVHGQVGRSGCVRSQFFHFHWVRLGRSLSKCSLH